MWSITENSKTRFGVGRSPKGASICGTFQKLYDPNTGTASEQWSYQPAPHASQPSQKWLYERTPR